MGNLVSQDELSDDLLNLLIAQTGSDVHSGLVEIINTTLRNVNY